MHKLWLPIPPSNNNFRKNYCTGVVNSYGHHVVRSSLTERAKLYKETVGWEAKAAGIRMSQDKMYVEINVYVIADKLTLDLDNIPKVVLDALTGIAWEDDKQVYEIRLRRRTCKKNPHIEVLICPYTEDNTESLDTRQGGQLAQVV